MSITVDIALRQSFPQCYYQIISVSQTLVAEHAAKGETVAFRTYTLRSTTYAVLSQVLGVKSHDNMHFQRSRGLGLLLSPGALGPVSHNNKNRSMDKTEFTDWGKEQFETMVQTWRDAWASPTMDIRRLNIWSDPDAKYQVRRSHSVCEVFEYRTTWRKQAK